VPDEPNPGKRRKVSGHVYLKKGERGSVWYWRIRLPEGFTHADGRPKREERRPIGPAWTGSGRTPDGHYTRRTAQHALEARLTDLRRGVGIPVPRVGATFRDAAEHWYVHRSAQQGWKPSTRRDYRSALDRHLLPAFGEHPLEDVTTDAIQEWRDAGISNGTIPTRTAAKLVMVIGGVYEQARKTYKLTTPNPARDVERIKLAYNLERFLFYRPEEIFALVRAAEQYRPRTETPPTPEQEEAAAASARQDGAIFLTAAFTGLRLGELLALCVRDVDFDAESIRVFGSVDISDGVGTPKSGRGRTVPMVDDVARALARLLQRERFISPDDHVFVGTDGRYLDSSALRRRYRTAQKQAGLEPIRFHDLRHTFGSLAITQAESVRELQDWMGHADARTTARYVHYKPRKGEARRLSEAFRLETPTEEAATGTGAADPKSARRTATRF
jgi:integrase